MMSLDDGALVGSIDDGALVGSIDDVDGRLGGRGGSLAHGPARAAGEDTLRSGRETARDA